MAHLTVSLFRFGSNARSGKSWAFERRRVSPSRVQDRDQGVAGRSGGDMFFFNDGSLISPPDKSMMVYKKEKEKMS